MPGLDLGILGVIPSVTEILSACNLSGDYSAIPPGALAWAQERGSAMHEAIGLFLAGELDVNALHPQLVPRVQGFAEWASRTGFVPLSDIDHGYANDPGPLDGIEHECVDLESRVVGHLDLIGYVHPGDLVLVDLKSSLDRKPVSVQIAAYSWIWHRQHPDLSIDQHIALVVNGKPVARPHVIDVKPATAVWLAALEVYSWKKR